MLDEAPRPIFKPEHEQFRQTVKTFFKKEVDPYVKQWEAAGMFDPAIFQRAAEYGLLQAGIPTEYGGMGGDFLHHVILHEEHGAAASGASIGGGLCIDGSGYVIWAGGTEEQKHHWLPRYASGETVAEAAFTESQSGSDVAGIRTMAKRDGDHYIVNGAKTWITNGSMCTMYPTVVRTELDNGGTALSVLLIDANMPGVSRSRGIPTLHRGSANEAEVFFADVRVPRDRLLGGQSGSGFRQVMSVLNDMRIAEAARFVKAAELGLALTVDFVRSRIAFGQRVLDFQNTRFTLADIKTEIAVAQAFIDQCLGKVQSGTLTPTDSSMAKLNASEMEFAVLDRCLQLHGGMGYAHESPISQLWSASRGHRIYLGTSEIHRVAIGKTFE